ncbi:MAG TPA: LysM peptidoglycan-binding domain-containing protein [Ferruginibacter sp.]|nr:LysM peptidoglycan-binding domain-containing protein [Ferruginibacter sp.]
MKHLLFLLFCLPLFAIAQNQPLLIQGTSPKLYVNHTVAAKENYYSLGRLYNISPKEIAPFNNLKLESGLSLGQTIMIPLTDNNFLQAGNPAADEALIPVYYVVHEKEGFYRISVNNNKVPIVTVKKWNNVTTDGVPTGTPLIIGYLKVKKELSLFATTPGLTLDQVKAAIQEPAIKPTTTTITTVAKNDNAMATAPAVISVTKTPTVETIVTKNNVQPPEEKVPVTTTTPADNEMPSSSQPIATPAVTFKQDEAHAGFTGFYGGVFKTDYDKHPGKSGTEDEKGDAAIFKSNSGWQDGKYYCLYDGAQAGSVVKIADNTTGRVIYAKVLDAMPDMKQNTGIMLRLSNAAAQELGVTDVKFDCTVTYYK